MSRVQKNERKKALARILGVLIILAMIISIGIYYLPNIILAIVSLNNRFLVSKTQIENDADKKDTLAPFPPKLSSLPDYSSENSIDIEGTAEKNSTVKLYRNGGFLLKDSTNSEEEFRFKDISLTEDTNEFYAVAVDPAGNESKKSDTQVVRLKTDGPTLEVSTEVNEDEGKVVISGNTQEDVVLTINGRRVIVSPRGSFSSTFSLQEGENKLHVIATDRAGNKAEQEISVTHNIDN